MNTLLFASGMTLAGVGLVLVVLPFAMPAAFPGRYPDPHRVTSLRPAARAYAVMQVAAVILLLSGANVWCAVATAVIGVGHLVMQWLVKLDGQDRVRIDALKNDAGTSQGETSTAIR